MSCNVENNHAIAWNATFDETGIFNAIARWWKIRVERRENRAAFQHLLALDYAMLADIGVNRGDVVWANNLPISQNASLELQRVAAVQNRARF